MAKSRTELREGESFPYMYTCTIYANYAKNAIYVQYVPGGTHVGDGVGYIRWCRHVDDAAAGAGMQALAWSRAAAGAGMLQQQAATELAATPVVEEAPASPIVPAGRRRPAAVRGRPAAAAAAAGSRSAGAARQAAAEQTVRDRPSAARALGAVTKGQYY